MAAVRFERVTRRFGRNVAVDGVSFEIGEGEFFSMLGPSGSGKTTCLRLIAGFETPDEGRVWLGGQVMRDVPPYDRPVNTVFQDYALFPHMNVRDNVAYGLTVRGLDRRTREARAEEMLEVVALSGFGDRRPAQLSGGQRQRVALARALVLHPSVLLLDEPLGALDLKLRQRMQGELRALQRQIGITFIYVTHDQGEALGMSDRVAVFNAGKVEQIGRPQDVYERPETAFVADFVGASNVFDAGLAERLTGRAQAFSLRPERIRVSPADGAPGPQGRVLDVQYLGAQSRIDVALDAGGTIMALAPNEDGARTLSPGDRVRLTWPEAAMRPLAS